MPFERLTSTRRSSQASGDCDLTLQPTDAHSNSRTLTLNIRATASSSSRALAAGPLGAMTTAAVCAAAVVLLVQATAMAAAAPHAAPAHRAAPPAVRNITGYATPFVVPADGAQNFTVVIRGSGFGTKANQPRDLVCRLKVR